MSGCLGARRPQDPMVRRRDVHDINAVGSGHVALNAVVVFALGQTSGSGKLASRLLMALEAPPAEIGSFFFLRRNLVRVVTRNAVKAAPAFAIAATELHLFDLPNRGVASILGDRRRPQKSI